jgi:hypothetical protein
LIREAARLWRQKEKYVMNRFRMLILLFGLIALPVSAEPDGQKETHMKSYTGKVQPMGMSIFMQGSHQLVDESGEMLVILQTENGKIDLNKFVNKTVKVSGNEEPAVEAGGSVLTVTSIDTI